MRAPGPRQYLVAVFALAGALRLGVHIVLRSGMRGRIRAITGLAVEWGADFPARRLFWFLQIQGGLRLPSVGRDLLAARNPAQFPAPGDAAGALVLLARSPAKRGRMRRWRGFRAARDPDRASA